jgi:hypothetical protein
MRRRRAKLFETLLTDGTLRGMGGSAVGPNSAASVFRVDPMAELHALPWADEGAVLIAAQAIRRSRYLPVALPWSEVRSARLRCWSIRTRTTFSLNMNCPADIPLERSRKMPLPVSTRKTCKSFHGKADHIRAAGRELRKRYHILHYLGHGAFNVKRQQAALCCKMPRAMPNGRSTTNRRPMARQGASLLVFWRRVKARFGVGRRVSGLGPSWFRRACLL